MRAQGQPQKQTPEVLCRKTVLKNIAIFTEKHLCLVAGF